MFDIEKGPFDIDNEKVTLARGKLCSMIHSLSKYYLFIV